MKILFTGLGSIGKRHLRLLREHEERFDFHAYRSGETETETPEDVIEHRSLDSALESHPDVAFITNPTVEHLSTAIRCASSGCDLFIEKPLSDTISGVDELEELVNENNLITYVGCNLRFTPILKTVREVLSNNRIGAVLSFRAHAGSYLPEWRPNQDYRESYSAAPELGGGVVLDLIHEFDYLYWLLGEMRTVTGHTGQISSLEIRSEDIAEVVLETETQAIGSIHLDYFRRTPKRTLDITGEYGVIRADFNNKTIQVDTTQTTDNYSFDYERDDVYRDQLEYFISHVRSREECQNNVTEARRVLQIATEVKEHDNE